MIKNKTRKKILSRNSKYCTNVFQKGLGLMFRCKDAIRDKGWIFPFRSPRRIAITMVFVHFPIDIIFLDAQGRVVDMVQDLKPWRFYNSGIKSLCCIELESGTIRGTGTKRGDVILLQK